jgi:prepilin peptidase CpaA
MIVAEALVVAFVAAFALVCLILDVRTGKIPNWLTVPTLGAGLIVHPIIGATVGDGWLAGLKFSALGFATGFALLLVLWLLGGSGGGDVKMMSALGSWLGVKLVIIVFLSSAAVTIVLMSGAMFYNLTVRSLASIRRASADPVGRRAAVVKAQTKAQTLSTRVLPYCVSLSVATWIVLAFACRHGNLF